MGCVHLLALAHMHTSLLDHNTFEEETKLNFIILFRNKC